MKNDPKIKAHLENVKASVEDLERPYSVFGVITNKEQSCAYLKGCPHCMAIAIAQACIDHPELYKELKKKLKKTKQILELKKAESVSRRSEGENILKNIKFDDTHPNEN